MGAPRKQGSDPLNILLVNLHSSCNAGDDALAHEAVRQLAEQFPGASFTLAMNDPASYRGRGRAIGSFTSWVKPIAAGSDASRWRWRAFPGMVLQSLLALSGFRLTGQPWHPFASAEQRLLLDSYFGADLVISAAGNFLYTSGWIGVPFFLSLFTLFYAQLAGKPVYALPQTLGPIRRKGEQWLAREVLSQSRLILIRDPISEAVCQAWNVSDSRWQGLPDLAFARPAEQDRQEAEALLASYGVDEGASRPWLGVTLIHWGAQSRTFDRQALYEEAMEAAIRDFVTSIGGQAVLFAQVQGPTASEDDRVPARRVLARLADLAGRVVLVDRWVPPDVLKAAYGHMDILIGTRLHSNIFALTEGVPVVAIGYQYKTRGVMRMLDMEPWVLDIDQVNREALTSLLRRAWTERARTRAHLEQVLPGIRERACQAGALIAADFRAADASRGRGRA